MSAFSTFEGKQEWFIERLYIILLGECRNLIMPLVVYNKIANPFEYLLLNVWIHLIIAVCIIYNYLSAVIEAKDFK